MKKSLIILSLIIGLLLINLVSCEDSNANFSLNNSALSGVGNIPDELKGSTEDVLDKVILIPESLQFPARILLGIKSDQEIKIGEFVVFVAIWVGLFMVLSSVLAMLPILNKKWQQYLGGAIITALISLTGSVKSIATFFFSLGNLFEWLSFLGPFQILVGLIIAVIIFFVVQKILKILEHRIKLGKAEESGREVGKAVALSKAMNESTEELTK